MVFGLFGKKEPSFSEGFPIKMVFVEGDKWIDVYGVISESSKNTISIFVPNLSQYMSNNLVPITTDKKPDTNLLEITKDGTVKLFNFESEIEDIDVANRIISIKKPSKFNEKTFGKAKEIINSFDFEVEIDIEYNALGVPHTQKAKTNRIFHNGISLFSFIPIPPQTVIEVYLKIPYEEYLEKKKDKIVMTVKESKQLEKKKFETILVYEKVEDRLKNLLLEYALVNQKV